MHSEHDKKNSLKRMRPDCWSSSVSKVSTFPLRFVVFLSVMFDPFIQSRTKVGLGVPHKTIFLLIVLEEGIMLSIF